MKDGLGQRANTLVQSSVRARESAVPDVMRVESAQERERATSTMSAESSREAATSSSLQHNKTPAAPPVPRPTLLPRSADFLSHGHDRTSTKLEADGSIGDEELDLVLNGGPFTQPPREIQIAHTTTESQQQLFDALCSLEASDDSMESYFPSYQDASRYDEGDTACSPEGSSCSSTESANLQAMDDTYLVEPPTMHVDYLSHKWLEEDIQASWKHMVADRSSRHSIENGFRLENAFWRAWGQKRWNLKTVHPQSIQWIGKDCDTTWLYGPFKRGKSEPQITAPSAKRKDSGIEVDSDSPRPILKTPRLCELFLQQSFSDVSLSGPVSPILDLPSADTSLLKPLRKKLEKFKTYSVASNSGYASPMRAKAVKFSGQVAQCISVDTEPSQAPHFASHHPILKRSSRSIHASSRSSSRDNSRASSPKPHQRPEKVQLIEPLPSTQLKPEGTACPLQSKFLGLNRKLFSLRDAALLSTPATLAAKERILKSQHFADDEENLSPSPESEPESPPRYDDMIDYKLLSQRITNSTPRPTNLPRSIVDRFYDLNSSEFDGSEVPTPPSMSDQFSSGSDDDEYDFLAFPAYPDMETSDNLLDTQAPNQFDCEPKIEMSSGSEVDAYGGLVVEHVHVQGGAGKGEALMGVNVNARRPSAAFTVKPGKGFGHGGNNDEEMWWSMV